VPRKLVVVASAMVLMPVVLSSPVRANCAASGNLREEIDDAEAVIVGTVTEAGVPDTTEPESELGLRRRWTIDVEEDIKGNVGSTLSFHSGWTSGSVGTPFRAAKGARIGLLLSRVDGHYAPSGCDRRKAEDVLAAAQPLAPPRGRGVPFLLAAGGFGRPRVALLDERGAVTAYGAGKGDARLGVCPGERFVVEVVSEDSFRAERILPTVEVRDLRTLRVVRRSRLPAPILSALPRRPFAVACRDREATDLLVAAEAGSYTARVVRLVEGTWETVYHDKARAVTFVRSGFAVIRLGGEKFELVAHAPDGRVRARLGPLPSFTHLSITEPVQLVADASGRYVAGANEQPDDGSPNLFVADLETRKVVRKHVRWVAGLAWAGTRLVAGPLVERNKDGFVDPSKGGVVRVYDTGLDLQRSWGRWTGLHPVVLGDRLFGVRQGRSVVSAPYRTGPEKVEGGIGDLSIAQLVALSGESAGGRGRPRLTWTAVALVLLLIVFAAIVVRSRRTPASPPTHPSR
jgi:hypothetical protein